MKRIFGNGSYANVTATVALVVALGGTSYAAIKLPKNSVTSVQVKDKSLLKKDFKTGQLPAGKTGPAGPAGPAAGAGGAGTGVGLFNRAEAAEPLLAGSADQPIQTLAPPAGSWVVTAKFIAENVLAGNPDPRLRCSLNIGGVVVDNLGPAAGIDFDQGASSNTLTGAGTLDAAGAATVVCNTDNSVSAGTYRGRSMTAVQASSVAAG
jgi:hypothetical protein